MSNESAERSEGLPASRVRVGVDLLEVSRMARLASARALGWLARSAMG